MIVVKERIVDNCKEGDSMLVKYMFFNVLYYSVENKQKNTCN